MNMHDLLPAGHAGKGKMGVGKLLQPSWFLLLTVPTYLVAACRASSCTVNKF